MFDQYQNYAAAQHGRVRDARNVPTGRTFNPGRPYQVWANTFNQKMINADDPRVPHTPVEDRAQGTQHVANGFLDRMIAHDDLQLHGRRKSGSFARAYRVAGLGDAIDVDIGEARIINNEPFYKNPYFIGAGVVAAGAAAWLLLRRKR